MRQQKRTLGVWYGGEEIFEPLEVEEMVYLEPTVAEMVTGSIYWLPRYTQEAGYSLKGCAFWDAWVCLRGVLVGRTFVDLLVLNSLYVLRQGNN